MTVVGDLDSFESVEIVVGQGDVDTGSVGIDRIPD